MTEGRKLRLGLLGSALVAIVAQHPISAFIDASLSRLFGHEFALSVFTYEHFGWFVGAAGGAALAFIVSDIWSTDSALRSWWRWWHGARAEVRLDYGNPSDGHFIYRMRVQLGRNSRSVVITARKAILHHKLSGETFWTWLGEPETLFQSPANKGQVIERTIVERASSDETSVKILGADQYVHPTPGHEVFRVEIDVNADGRIEHAVEEFDVYTPGRPRTLARRTRQVVAS